MKTYGSVRNRVDLKSRVKILRSKYSLHHLHVTLSILSMPGFLISIMELIMETGGC